MVWKSKIDSMTEPVALLIEWDPNTGERAGGINPKDPGLVCFGWQKMDTIPAKEIRLIMDGRDVSQYENVPGLTILRGREAINKAIDDLNLARYVVDNEALFREHLSKSGIDLSVYSDKPSNEILKDLFENKKIIGIRKIEPRKL